MICNRLNCATARASETTILIIRRYLISQVASTTLVVTALLTLVTVGGRLIKYFGVAAQGRLDASVLLSIVGFRLLDFLVLIVPLSFFIAIMLVFGRLYVDHEMAVLNSSGVSRDRLGLLMWPLVLVLVLAEATLTLFAAPWGSRQSDQLFAEQALRSGFELVKPGEFVSSGAYTIYAGALSEDRRELRNVFFYQRAQEAGEMDRMIVAERAQRVIDPTQTASVVDLVNGRQYQILPNGLRYNHAEFSYYRLRLAHDNADNPETTRLEAAPIAQLWPRRHEAAVQAELGWRLSMPWVMLLAAVLAVPLSEVSPRQGRYIKLFPAIILFASLVVLLVSVKTRVSKEKLEVWMFAVVLVVYLLLGLFLAKKQRLAPQVKKRLKGVIS